MTSSCSDHGRNHGRIVIVIATSTVFREFFLDFGLSFCVAGAAFGEVGG